MKIEDISPNVKKKLVEYACAIHGVQSEGLLKQKLVDDAFDKILLDLLSDVTNRFTNLEVDKARNKYPDDEYIISVLDAKTPSGQVEV